MKGLFRSTLVRSSAMMVGAQGMLVPLGILAQIFAARGLGMELFGQVSIVVSFPSLVWGFSTVKTLSITTRFVAQYDANQDRVRLRDVLLKTLKIDAFTSAVAFLIILAGAGPVAQRMHHPELSTAIVLYASVFLFKIPYASALSVINGLERFALLSTTQVLAGLGSVVAALVVFLVPVPSVLMYIGLLVGAEVAITLLTCILAGRLLLGRMKGYAAQPLAPSLERESLRHLFGWNFVISTLSGISSNLPPLLLGRVADVGDRNAAFYRLAFSVSSMSGMFESAIGNVLMPRLSRQGHSNARAVVRNLLRMGTMRLGLLLATGSLAVVVFSPWIVELAYGGEFAPATAGIQWMLMASVFSGAFFWVQPYFFSRGWVKRYAASSLVLGFVVAVSLLVSPTFETGARAYLIGRVAALALNLWQILRFQGASTNSAQA